MSIDVSVSLYFPISKAGATLEATRKVLRERKFVLGIQIETSSGETIRIPAEVSFGNQVEVYGPEGMRMVDVPTISPVFPDVMGEEPVFSLSEISSLSGLTAEVAFRKDGKVVDQVPVSLSIARGQDYLELSMRNLTSSDAQRFLSPRFRSKIGTILEAGGGVAAAYCTMGEWISFADHTAIEDPDGQTEEAGVDAFVEFLIEKLQGSD